jgi:hypothetical protein
MKLKSARVAFAAIAAVVLATSLTACAPSTGYPAAARSNFLSSCTAQAGATAAMCERCFDAVEEAYTYEEFVALDTAIANGTASQADTDKLTGIVASCA